MPAQQLTGFGTPYQRIVLQELQDLGNSWTFAFGGTSIFLSAFFNRTFTLEFIGSNLGQDAAGTLTGSVTGIKISTETPAGPLDIADITGLNIPDFATFVDSAKTLTQGEPDFAVPSVAAFYNAVTPNVIKGSDSPEFFEWGTNPVTINTGKGNDVIIAGPGGGVIKMGAGKNDAIDFRNLDSPLTLDIETGTASAGSGTFSFSGVKTFFGTDLADTLGGSSGVDRIFGRGADDTITGLRGNDLLYGDRGDDDIMGGNGNDSIWGQANKDTLRGGNGDDRLRGGGGRDWLNGQKDDDFLAGGKGRDTLRGGTGNDDLNGGDGNDKLFGGKGTDSMLGGEGQDTLNGADGADTLTGGLDDDVLFGGKGRDFLFGQDGNDALFGGSGADWLEGGRGDDNMTGGAGIDEFYFFGINLGNDSLVDYVLGEDRISFFGQTAADVSIARSTPGNFTITHAQGTVTLFDITDSFMIDDIQFL